MQHTKVGDRQDSEPAGPESYGEELELFPFVQWGAIEGFEGRDETKSVFSEDPAHGVK